MFNLQEEERCGHLVTEQMKRLWQVELGCLEEVKRICKKHGIKYFAGDGTLLGAVRHQGFIPWDDDIDIHMLSEDYERFCQIAPTEVQAPYFFQHYSTQEVDDVRFARIRNSNTTGCTKYEYENLSGKAEYNCGIFIDIFPLNYVPNSKLKIKWQQFCIRMCNSARTGCRMIKKAKELGKKPRFHKSMLFWWMLRPFVREDKLLHTVYAARDMYKSGNEVGVLSLAKHTNKYVWKYVWNKDWFEETVELPFEDTTICCPKEYDKILRREYGDYSVFVKGTQIHTLLIVDPDTPYEQKIKECTAEHFEAKEGNK